MKDIKTLYLTAKRSGKQTDLFSYTEAVRELLESDPNGFISNLEYIITSDINLPKLNQFVEKYGLAIPLCDTIIEHLEQSVDKCRIFGKDPTEFIESLNGFKEFKSINKKLVDMYEYYSDDNPDTMKKYIESYYSFNKNGIQGRKLPAGMITKFGESAIPDTLITASLIGTKALTTIYEYLYTQYGTSTDGGKIFQWVVECSANIGVIGGPIYEKIKNTSLQGLVSSKDREFQKYVRESAINGNDDVCVEYSESDIQNVMDLIEFKEYQLTCLESSDEIMKIQNEIYSLYESIGGIVPSGSIMLEKSKSPKDDAISKVADKLISLGKELSKGLSKTIKSVRKEIKSGDDEDDRKIVRRCWTRGIVAIGDKYDEFKIFTFNSLKARNETSKKLYDDVSSNSEYLSDLRYHIIIEFSRGLPFKNREKEEMSKIADKMLMASSEITELINKGILKFSKSHEVYNPDPTKSMIDDSKLMTEYYVNYTIYYYTIRYTVSISRNYAFEGVDRSILESGGIKFFMDELMDTISSIRPMYVSEAIMTEGRFDNTDNKYTGNAPSYLSNNHDLSYGENEPKSPEEEYRRPSAGKPMSDESDDVDNYQGTVASSNHPPVEKPVDDDDLRAINNYYYYTYTNSLNKNSNSFNRDNSSHDNHSSTGNRYVDDHSTGKRINSNDYTGSRNSASNEPDQGDDNMEESAYTFIEAVDYHLDDDKCDEQIKKTWFVKSSDDVDNCCVSVEGYEKPMRGRSSMIVIKKDNNEWQALIKKISNGEWEFPGGGWNRGEKPIDAANRELNEETQTKAKNVKRLGTSIQYNDSKDAILSWIKTHVKDSDDWWYGYYSAIFIGEEDGKFTGHINEEDFEDTFQWKPLSFIAKKFPKKLMDSVKAYIQEEFKESVDCFSEAAGDADDMRPESDHPIKDIAQDADRALAKTQQAAKKTVQNAMNAGSAFMKPIKRTHNWVMKLVNDWKDKDETKIKEKFADPHARKNIFSAITWCIKTGSLAKAGLLFNPIFLFLTVTKNIGKKDKMSRIRHEMIGELKTEMEIIEVKINDAANAGDNAAKYKLMRLKNEINKKLLRVGGSDVRDWKKLI